MGEGRQTMMSAKYAINGYLYNYCCWQM